MIMRLSALTAGVILDWIFGDPRALPHPVRGMGHLVEAGERWLRKRAWGTDRTKGICLVIFVLCVSVGLPLLILLGAWAVEGKRGILSWCIQAFFCFQLLAARGLYTESQRVGKALAAGKVEEARKWVSMIVGRDTSRLDEGGIARAAVETVAENASDGVIAPLLYLAVFGIPGGFFFKAVNTMGFMVGYKNQQYLEFGRAAAKLDDFCNLLPARLTGAFLTGTAWFLKRFSKKDERKMYNEREAWRIFLRDRRKHSSPNSAHGEAACAGALGLKLGGDSWYFGKLVHKPWIGDERRAIEAEDIRRAGKLMIGSEILALALCWIAGGGIWLLLR